MRSLLTAAELEQRAGSLSLPLNAEGNADKVRINIALADATGIIVAQLPWLLDGDDLIDPIPLQFEGALLGVCADIALNRLTDKVSSGEDQRELYNQSIKLLEKIDREYKGGLSGPDLQEASLVIGGGADETTDPRYWKKGKVL